MLDTYLLQDNQTKYSEYDNSGIVYLFFSDMHNWASKASYVQLFEEAAQLLDEHPGSKLVIDLCQNFGGRGEQFGT